jgi:RimJ/RimL family protein N-acetyltransferase
MYLTNGNLVIRDASAKDAQILCKWWNDGKVMAHAGFPKGLGTTPHKIALDLATDTDGGHRRLILEIDSVPVGEMNYRNKENNVVEIGIKICDFDRQGKGFGPLFLKMLIGYLFNMMVYEKIILDTNATNTRAQHVYESIGFRKVAIRINSWKNQVGEPQSSIDYALIKSEYFNITK